MAQAAIEEKMAEKKSAPKNEEETEFAGGDYQEESEDDEVEMIQQEADAGDEYDERLRRLLDR